jgi:hypothetical protein
MQIVDIVVSYLCHVWVVGIRPIPVIPPVSLKFVTLLTYPASERVRYGYELVSNP